MDRLSAVATAPRAKGQKDLLAYLNGQRLTASQAIIAKCYDCMGYYVDGKEDCETYSCPLHPYMPYRRDKS